MGHRVRWRHGAADGHHTQQDHPMRLRFVVLALLVATTLRAQTGSARDEMARAERAYRDLEFDVAASTLRQVLAPPLATQLDDSARARALTYLGAAEHYQIGRASCRERV